METKVTFRLQALTVFIFLLEACTTPQAAATPYHKTGPGVGGVNLLMVFQRGTKEYYMRSAQATSNYSATDGYDIIDTEFGNETVYLQHHATKQYLQIQASNKILVLGVVGTASSFILSTVNSTDVFQIHYNGIPLVAYQSTAPFDFYLKERYPTEPSATFYLIEEFDVEGSYAGIRSNILPTVNLFRQSVSTDKLAAYSKLIDLMHSYTHVAGEEIFYVAYYLQQDFGVDSDPFLQLPELVQLLFAENDLRWYFKKNEQDDWLPIKYVAASSSHENILPYNFKYRPSTTTASSYWSIHYALVHQIYVSDYPYAKLLERISEDQNFQFRLSLSADLVTFNTFAHVPSDTWPYYLRPKEEEEPFTFNATNQNNSLNAKYFLVQKY